MATSPGLGYDNVHSLKVLPLDSSRWSYLDPVDLEWMRSSIGSDDKVLREKVDAVQKE